MSIARLRVLAIAVALAGSGVAISLLHAQGGNPPAWVVGDVFVAVGSGKYEVRSSAGTLKQTITSNVNPKKDVAGCWFDSQFNLYTADFNNTKVVKYNFATPHAASTFANTELQAPDGHSSSIVMAVNGDVYVGNAGNANGTGTRNILRYRSDGAFLGSFTPAVEDRGIDWMDLATDQRTMFYTSRGRLIKRFNVGTITQLGNFADLSTTTPTGEAYAIRLLPPFDGTGGLLVADNVNIKRLNGAGAVVATYDYDPAGSNNDEDTFQSLNLDPDGLHFWAGGNSTGRLYRFALNSPTPDLGPIQTDGKGALMGICVLGEPQTQVRPLALSNPSGSTQLIDITAPFGDPAATGENASYSFSTWRLRIRVKAGQSVMAAVSFTPESTTMACNTSDPADFDCRFTNLDNIANTQCVPFFRDPSAPNALNSLDPYRCGYYRVKGVPVCTSPGNCPFDEPFVANSTDIQAEIILNLTNPPTSVFNIPVLFGNGVKGNPRLARDPDSIGGNQFGIDSTTAVIDWPAFGSGFPNDYSPVQRATSTPGGGCATIISPNGSGHNSGASIKMVVDVKTGPIVNGVCTGSPVTGASIAPKNITLAVAGTGTNTNLLIYCVHPSSNDCFQESSPGRYQANVDLDPVFLPPDNVNPYIFAVTSVNIQDALGPNNPGVFPPTSRQVLYLPERIELRVSVSRYCDRRRAGSTGPALSFSRDGDVYNLFNANKY